MNLLRKGALGVVAPLFFTTLLTFGFTWGLLHVFGNADSIKGALARSGIYQSVVSSALDQVQKEQKSGEGDEIPLNDPEIKNIIKTAASPELLQTKTENALDSTYAWLHGETATLSFNLELADIKTNLGNGLEQYVAQHVAAMPVCAPGTAGNASDDPFNATCRPEGTDPNQLAAQTKSEFMGGEFLKDTTINAENIKGDDGKTLAEQVGDMPNIYKNVSRGVYGSGLLAAVLALGVILLSATWRSGIRKVAIVLIVLGVLTTAVSLLVETGLHRAVGAVEEPLQQSGIKVAEALAGSLRSWWLWYGIAQVVVGVGGLVGLRFLKPKTGAAESTEDKPERPEPHAKELPVTQTVASLPSPSASQPSTRPKPAKKLVQ